MTLDDLRLAAALLREPSLSAAARSLGVTPPALSARLRKLEATLGLTLASRTARALHLTSEGERLGREALVLLRNLDALRDSLLRDDQKLTGTLHVAAPFGYGRTHIAPRLAAFAHEHPSLKVQLYLRETPWPDRHHADAVVHVGKVSDSSWVRYPLAANDRWLVASPEYLRRHGTPGHPNELIDHACICIRENDEDVTLWHAQDCTTRTARKVTLRVDPTYVTNDGSSARLWAEAGMGIVLRSEWDVRESIESGRMVRVLAAWSFGDAPIVLLVPHRKGRSARVQALIDFLSPPPSDGPR